MITNSFLKPVSFTTKYFPLRKEKLKDITKAI